ncbi:UNVERIFIED_CONTAM: Kinesin-like protein KIN-8B [Sesamum calycinum]|uniref:Kinesin-like protein KIN-8B n=1 Tax=Sesamum calycinum TaxID=2727403 RepID=A0AAW2SUJ4_9LAMI
MLTKYAKHHSSSYQETTTLTVAVKCRPLTERERGRDIVRVHNAKEVLVLDPDLSKDYLERVQNRTKERRYTFDYAFDPNCSNLDVYTRSIRSTIVGVVQGLNATIFAYGSTGSGKTYTMVGTQDDPGLMVLSLNTIFHLIEKDNSFDDFEVTCSYLEVYNEVIYDLLVKSSGHLELREDPDQGIVVAGLRSIKVNSADKILELLNLGNSRRKTESTEITCSSRDKCDKKTAKGISQPGYQRKTSLGILRAATEEGLAYVPYRNSKLTRILKDGLSGNSQTVMIATISPADNQYHHTVNTLKYADRAKEIKTHIQSEVTRLRMELADKESLLNAKLPEKAVDVEISWLDALSQETNENVQERINLQKALIELEETNLRNRKELQHLDEAIAKQQVIENDGVVVQALQTRRQLILDNIRDNDELGVSYQKEIEANEKRRCQLQDMIDEAIKNNGNKTYLGILSQYRLLGITNTELQFEIAIRDQIIYSQREAQRNLWNLLMSLGLDEKQIVELGAKQGITVEDIHMTTPLGQSNLAHYPNLKYERYAPSNRAAFDGQSGAVSPCLCPQDREFSSRSFAVESQKLPPAFFQEHHTSYYYISHGLYPSANQQWCSNPPSSHFRTLDQRSHGLSKSFPPMSSNITPYDDGGVSSSSFKTDFWQQQQQDAWPVTNRQDINMNPYVGRGSTGMARHHGGITPGTFGHLELEQGVGNINPQHGFPKTPTSARQQSVGQMLPSHVTSKFKHKQF